MSVWKRLHFLFDTDDGALYDVRLTELQAEDVAIAFDFLRSRAQMDLHATFWHRGLDREERLDAYSNPARLVADGVAEPFHVLAQGLSLRGVTLPDLGVFVWPDEITLDYFKGPAWGEPQVLALFELLRQLVALAPGSRVHLCEHTLPKVDRLFVEAWSAYCQDVLENPGAADGTRKAKEDGAEP
jgi:hypothetical protein